MTKSEKKDDLRVALVGNPNSGKSTIFNYLTGLRQKTGNFPGVTVEMKEGKMSLPGGRKVEIVDFPGAYSLYPTSSDEKVVSAVMANPADPHFPDAIVYVADVTRLEKHLLLFTQLLDLQAPLILALNMADAAASAGITVNIGKLSAQFGVPVLSVSARTGENMLQLEQEIEKAVKNALQPGKTVEPKYKPFYPLTAAETQIAEAVRHNLGIENPYRALLALHHRDWLPSLQTTQRETLAAIAETKKFQSLRAQVDETMDRFDRFTPIVRSSISNPPVYPETRTDRIDAILTHRVAGPFIFFALMLLIFQAIFNWSQAPMDWIESGFGFAKEWLSAVLPAHWLTSLITDGVIEGLGGILVFVPQIAVLFLLISILEEVGYMSRVVFMFDKSMRRYGMNGRSVVSLISGGACAVPAIMSTRTIGNWKERLITTMVTPFISCSARIPVYLILTGLAVPAAAMGGFGRTIVFGSLYLLGVLAAFATGWAMKKWLRMREHSYLAIEMPVYRAPHWRNVWMTVWEKVLSFIVDAGKVILLISVVLWVLAAFGPGTAMQEAEQRADREALQQGLDSLHTEDLRAHYRLESSYAGMAGKWMEPVIRPLGYDWKIGVALLTSFAAREVFTGTLAILYNLESAEGDINDRSENEAKATLRVKLLNAKHSDDGSPVYTIGTAFSLLVFYALAMQCMSTLAVVKRETGSWKWPAIQFSFMTFLAYVCAWAAYHLGNYFF